MHGKYVNYSELLTELRPIATVTKRHSVTKRQSDQQVKIILRIPLPDVSSLSVGQKGCPTDKSYCIYILEPDRFMNYTHYLNGTICNVACNKLFPL